jgi:hypothetical protein
MQIPIAARSHLLQPISFKSFLKLRAGSFAKIRQPRKEKSGDATRLPPTHSFLLTSYT